MKRPWHISLVMLGFANLAAGLALEQREVALAMVFYWGGLGVLFALALRSAMILHAEKKSEAALRADGTKGLWLAPLSRKVDWAEGAEEPGETYCFWQGETIRQTWKAQGEVWAWVQNTTKDAWPKELEFQDSMRWWKGVAVYQKISPTV